MRRGERQPIASHGEILHEKLAPFRLSAAFLAPAAGKRRGMNQRTRTETAGLDDPGSVGINIEWTNRVVCLSVVEKCEMSIFQKLAPFRLLAAFLPPAAGD